MTIGNIEPLWNSLKDLVCLFDFGRKPKITSVAILYLIQLIQCVQFRPDFAAQVSEVARYCNEVLYFIQCR
jgi:hypothetical protein